MSSRAIGVAAWFLLAAVFGACCFRAATEALTLDEAITYQLYVVSPWIQFVASYDANHHVLHSLLCRVAAAWWGDSELVLRLPSLLAGLAYLLLARALTVGAGATSWSLLTFTLMVANPFVVDYLSLARGYSLSLALFFGALALWLRLLRVARTGTVRWRLAVWIGLLQALALLANLAVAVPVAALTFVGTVLLRRVRAGQPWRATLGPLAWRIACTSLAVVVLLGLPLVNARPHHFYFGTATLYASARSLVAASFDHGRRLAEVLPAPWVHALLAAATMLALAVVVVAGVAAVVVGARGLRFALAAGTLAGAVLVWTALHHGAGVPWPFERTGLVAAPCAALAVGSGVQALAQGRARLLAQVAAWLLVAVAVRFAAQPWTGPYRTWRSDASAARVHAVLRAETVAREQPLAVLCANAQGASLTYYNLRHPTEPPIVLHQRLEPGVDHQLIVVDPSFSSVRAEGERRVCEVAGLGVVTGRLVFEDPMNGMLVLAR